MAIALLFVATLATAHDGGFGHSRRTLYVAATPDGWTVEYRIVLNRDEALVEMTHTDADGDGQVSAEERARYLSARSRALAERLPARDADGAAVALKPLRCELGPALSQTYHFAAQTAASELTLDDRNFAHKPGVVQLRAGPGVIVELAKPAELTHAERVSIRVRKKAMD